MKGTTIGYCTLRASVDFRCKEDTEEVRDYLRSVDFRKDLEKIIDDRFAIYGAESSVSDLSSEVYYDPLYEVTA